MKIKKSREELEKEFKELCNDYNKMIKLRFKIENIEHERESDKGYIQILLDRTYKGKHDKLENQEKEEKSNRTSLRFYKKYVDNLIYSVFINKDKVLPEYLHTKCLPRQVVIDGEQKFSFLKSMQIETKDEEYQKALEKYISLPENIREQRIKKNIYKKLAILSARGANIINMFKFLPGETIYMHKNKFMSDFLLYATKYNSLVDIEDQIAFGIDKDEENRPALNASIPGYTRLSLHFGSYSNCKNILKEVNTKCNQDVFPIYRNGNINMDRVFREFEYGLPKFDVINTGLMNSLMNGAEIYVQKLKQMLKDSKDKSDIGKSVFEQFSRIYNDFNDRDIFFIAEMAELGRGYLESLRDVLKFRESSKSYEPISELGQGYDELEIEDLLNTSSDEDNILEKELTKKIIEEDELDFLFKQSDDKSEPLKLKDEVFKRLFNSVDLKGKALLLLKTVESRFSNEIEPNDENELQLYREKSRIEKEKLNELVLEQVIEDESLEEYGDSFVEIILDASNLIELTSNSLNDISEQKRLVKNLWDNYKSILCSDIDHDKILDDDKKDFKELLYSFWVNEAILEDFESIETDAYEQMRGIAQIQGVIKRNEIEKRENIILKKGKPIKKINRRSKIMKIKFLV